MSKRTALLTGIRGQDAAYLAKLLLSKGYEVIGTDRRCGSPSYWRLEELDIKEKITYEYMDVADTFNVQTVIDKYKPDEIYNLAAQSFVQTSFDQPQNAVDVNMKGILNILEAVKNFSQTTKVYQASTSEMFGKVQEVPQKETTPFYPRSPYGVAKLGAHWFVKNYRESYGLFCCSGILFNHEGELRGEEFITRKISNAVANIFLNKQEFLELGNLDAKRDWGYAGDYVECMYEMLQQNTPEDYVIATNETHSVREFVELAFRYINVDIIWEGNGIDEIGKDKKTGKILVKINTKYFRPCEVDLLIGDYSKAKNDFGWEPKIRFKELVEIMVNEDIKRNKTCNCKG
jgi:GDPmannose 4,6-dehydratase